MNENTKSRLASRKLWVAIGGLIAVFATEWAGLDPAMAEKIIAAVVVIVPSYIGGQGIVDAVLAYTKGGGTTTALAEKPEVAKPKKAAKKSAK